MAVVYVLNKEGKPLMPTKRCGHVRILLKEGKAIVVERIPFTIQLKYDTPDITQDLYLGIDPGRTNIGLAVIDSSGDSVFTAKVITRNKDIPKLMKSRKCYRQKHRKCGRRDKRRRRARKAGTIKAPVFYRKLPGCKKPIEVHDIKNKEAKFNHRTRPEGWLTPTANQLLETHINVVKLVSKFLPITDVAMELNQFSFMQLDNPFIKPWEYQKGLLHGYHGDVHRYVSEQQDNHCIFCKKKIEHYHHMIPRHEGGSDAASNIVGLCSSHHGLVHTDTKWKEKLSSKKSGLSKKYGALSILNQIMPRLEHELSALYPGHVFAVSGRDTKCFREDNNITKDHQYDAYCIASVVVGNKGNINSIKTYVIRQFRRHDRQSCHQENLKRKYYLDGKLVATNRHKAYEQNEIALDEYLTEIGYREGVGKAFRVLRSLTVKEHKPIMKDMSRSLPGSLFRDNDKIYVLQGYKGKHNGKVDYYIDTNGNLHLANRCMIIQNNTGLRFAV